jgi:hypothetical protein
MKSFKIYYLFLLLTPSFIEGCFCRTTKKIGTALIKKDTTSTSAINENTDKESFVKLLSQIDSVKTNEVQFKTLKIKAKIEYADTKDGYPELNGYINIKHKEKIWIRIALPGIDYEVVRALITPDSIIVLENKSNTAYMRSFSYLQEVTNLPFNFNTIENLLVGNAIVIPDSIIGYKYQNNELNTVSYSKYFKELLTIDTTIHKVTFSKLEDVDPLKSRTCQVTYGQYEKVGDRLVTMLRDIIVSEKNTSSLKMQIKNISFDNDDLNFSIKIPKKYKIK